MAPQFVDFNADGHTDIFTATFDGSPWVALGGKEGFQQPQHIKDKNGERVRLSQYWDYESKKWTHKDHTGGVDPNAHCISAYAFDWDADGDLDLVLGGRDGYLWLQLNEGSAKEPKFSGTSQRILCGDKALDAGDKITSPRLVDFDGDGLSDLVLGTFGDSYGDGKGGSIKWYRNTGKKGAPVFAPAQTIVDASDKSSKEATRPDGGLYFDLADLNGDGLLDLIVGGYSMWTSEGSPKGRATVARKPHVWVYHQKPKTDAAK
ncbi:MAG: VCBS repeat-containing protein [Planctomycetaceae bacterium]|nr:hypothetical protein [Planctomycetota bacterium]NUO17022.1 VCBS repeat-containing protein [Planctomycetaceae bacterium]GIK53068.1 MAG: hypothetical protein BroJett014_20410 [Planctomycetota bacterium]